MPCASCGDFGVHCLLVICLPGEVSSLQKTEITAAVSLQMIPKQHDSSAAQCIMQHVMHNKHGAQGSSAYLPVLSEFTCCWNNFLVKEGEACPIILWTLHFSDENLHPAHHPVAQLPACPLVPISCRPPAIPTVPVQPNVLQSQRFHY